jgi:hypothetical protein
MVDKHKNPIKAIREQLGMSRKTWCAIHGVSYQMQTLAEGGYCQGIPEKIKSALTAAGIDARELEENYKSWRSAEALGELAGTKN